MRFKGRAVVKDSLEITCFIAEKNGNFTTNLIRDLSWMIDQQHFPVSEISSVEISVTINTESN